MKREKGTDEMKDAGLAVVDESDEPDETRGQRIRRRREALEYHYVKHFADAIGGVPNRETIAKAERDDPTVEETTYRQIEAALARLEKERTDREAAGPRVLRARIAGRGGFEVTFEAPTDAPHELASLVAEAMRDLVRPPPPSEE